MKKSPENSKKFKLHMNSDYNGVGLKLEDTIHGCDICDVTFPEKEAFDAHFKKFHANEELYSCDICYDKFPQKIDLDLHNGKFHEEENPFICDDCKCGFAEEHYFRNHFCMFPCSICDKIFEGENSLKTHIASVHEGKELFAENDGNIPSIPKNENEKVQEEKDTVENRFPQVGKEKKQQIYTGSELKEEFSNIKADLKDYSGKKKCLKRQQSEAKKSSDKNNKKLKLHHSYIKENFEESKNNHEDEKIIYECSICQATYKSREKFNKHIATVHEREKQTLECDICKNIYQTKEGLRHHNYSVHEGNKFQCDICGTSLTSKQGLESHILNMHTEKRSYKCRQCDENFLEKALLDEHVESFHKKSFQCEICGYSCSEKNRLIIHIERTHEGKRPFVCELCGASYKYKHALKDHEKKHEEKTEKPFKCEICSTTFGRACHLGNHIAKIHEKKEYSYSMQYAIRKANSSIPINEPSQGKTSKSKLLKESSFDTKITSVYNENTCKTDQVEKDTHEDRFSQADQEKKQQINPESSQIDFFSEKEDGIQSIDCETESSNYHKSVRNIHQNELSKYLEDSNERKH